MTRWIGRTVLVTGSSAGLGLAIARAFVLAGASVVLTGRNAGRLAEALESLVPEGGPDRARLHAIEGNLTDPVVAGRVVVETVERFGRLDVVVCNLGGSTRGRILETTPDALRMSLDLNVLPSLVMAQASAAALTKVGGQLVLVGSLAGRMAGPNLGPYPIAKAGIEALAQQLRLELKPAGVNVLLVVPGPIRRDDAGHRYDQEATGLSEAARQPGGGVKLRGLDPARLSEEIVAACERRRSELLRPRKARLLFALAQLSPTLGGWLLRRFTRS